MDLFYAVHVHAQDEWSPYRDPGLTGLDVAAAQGYVDRASFHFTFGTAAGLCSFDPGFLADLERRGHEIGIQAHTNAFLLRAADEMREAGGRDIATGRARWSTGAEIAARVAADLRGRGRRRRPGS